MCTFETKHGSQPLDSQEVRHDQRKDDKLLQMKSLQVYWASVATMICVTTFFVMDY